MRQADKQFMLSYTGQLTVKGVLDYLYVTLSNLCNMHTYKYSSSISLLAHRLHSVMSKDKNPVKPKQSQIHVNPLIVITEGRGICAAHWRVTFR